MTTINREATPEGDNIAAPNQLHSDLHDIWGNPRGLKALTIVNHTTLGLRFMVTGMAFFLLGGPEDTGERVLGLPRCTLSAV